MKKRKSQREKNQERYDLYIRQLSVGDFQRKLKHILTMYDNKVVFWKCFTAVNFAISASVMIIKNYVG